MAAPTIDHLFDTTVFIDFWRNNSRANTFIKKHKNKEISAAYSIITIAELWVGIKDKQSLHDHEIMLNPFRLLNLEEAIARRAGELVSKYQPPQKDDEYYFYIPDALIAATAEHFHLKLVTSNPKHFKTISQAGIIELVPYPKE
jgi:predicted nucleic acid-binding protein